MGEIAKRMKNKWMSWSARGARNLLNLLLRRYVERERYESFIRELIGKVICGGEIPSMMKQGQFFIMSFLTTTSIVQLNDLVVESKESFY